MKKEEILEEEKHECDDCHCDEGHECDDCHCEDEDCCDEGCCEDGCCDEEEGCCGDKEILLDKIQELEEKLLRNQADTINYRKRKDEEMMKFVKYANEGLVIEILPLLDNFERALSMDDSKMDDEVSKFLKGFKMIHDNFVSTLTKFSVKEINGINKPFDPIYHEAVLKEAVDGVEPGMVTQVLQKGYLLNDKVIRPAMVKVSE